MYLDNLEQMFDKFVVLLHKRRVHSFENHGHKIINTGKVNSRTTGTAQSVIEE